MNLSYFYGVAHFCRLDKTGHFMLNLKPTPYVRRIPAVYLGAPAF